MRKLSILVMLLPFVLTCASASSLDYPSRPIRIVVGAPVGGGVDVASRVLAESLRDELGQPVVVENKSGADGIIAARNVSASAPDGYTLWPATNGQMSIVPFMQSKLPFDPMRDFEPVSMIARWPLVLVVTPQVPVSSVRELIAHAKAHPNTLNYGSTSSGYTLGTEMFKKLAGIDLRHIPYNGATPVVTALLAGDVQVAILNVASASAQVKAGKLKALAVIEPVRVPILPDVPTLAEAGIQGYEFNVWLGMFAPAGTPPEIIVRLNEAITRSVKSPEFRDQLVALGMVPMRSSPQFLREAIVHDTKVYGELVKALRATAP